MDGDAELVERARARVGVTLRDKYRIDAVLGIGGMAVVYRATDRHDAHFAIKMLHPELSIRESLRKRFLREGYAANAVKHPAVVRIIDEDVAEDGAAFLVMEMLEGTSLEVLAQQAGGRLQLPLACSVLDQLLDVLAVAHASGIVHRDIKPSNLFVERDGTLKVLDFGIARVRDGLASEKDRTATGVLLGTPAFMAPEQARGKSSEIDARTDLWAAAATFFTLVSGETVHEGETSAELLIHAATSFPRSVRAVANVPDGIARVVDRALSFDRAARQANAAEMRDELRDACVAAYGAAPSRAHLALDVPAVSSARTLASDASDKTIPAAGPTTDSPTLGPPASQARFPLLQLALLAGVVGTAATVIAISHQQSAHVEPASVEIASSATPSAIATPSVTASAAPIIEPPPRAQPSVKPPQTRPVPSPAKSSCDPPYYFKDGMRIFKKDCVQ